MVSMVNLRSPKATSFYARQLAESHAQNGRTFGVFEADLRSDELRKNGVKIRIQDLPFRALKLLLGRPNEVITREEFRQALWPGDVFVDFALGIRSAVKRLRDALGDSAENPIFVETVDRRGYRWIAPTHVSEAASATGATNAESEESDPASGANESAVETLAPHSATPTTKIKKTVWIVAVVIVMAVVLLRGSGWKRRLFGNPDSGLVHSVAVLPFENAGSDKDADFLRLALPDEVANVANNRGVWRDTLSVAAADKIAMREQITSQVRQGLVPVLGGSSAPWETGTRPQSEEAYDLYLRSIAVPHDVGPKKDAIAMLERAVGLDPGYAPAWAALGMRYYYDAIFGGGGEAMLKRSDSAFERALALDPNLISAAGALITNQTDRGNIGTAYAQASALVKRRSESASAHFVLGYVLRYAGLLDEAARECDAAIKLDRGNYQFRSCSGFSVDLVNHRGQWSLFASMRARTGRQDKRRLSLLAKANWPRRVTASRERRTRL